ncbi:MAG: hypothetical protein NVSMB21_02790 [Vulcanimicrobiaceae bacterium]
MNTVAPPTPRRWNVEVDGIRWLPRMIDKARMREAGALGPYLLGHSPVDRALLRALGLTTDAFAAIVAASAGAGVEIGAGDARALAALRARGFDEARVREWSDRFERRYAALIPLWDLDEGYTTPSRVQAAALAGFRLVEGPLMAFARRVTKAP